MTDPTEKEIHVRYFAMLRDAAGRAEEVLRTSAQTPRDL